MPDEDINAQSSASNTSDVKGNNAQEETANSLDKYCPSNTPITIPYMEIYRTDELYYVEYESPFNNSGGSDTNSDEGSESNTDEDGNSVSGSGGCGTASWNYIYSLIRKYGTGQGHTTYTGIKNELLKVGSHYPCKNDNRLNEYNNVLKKFYPNLDNSARYTLATKLNNVVKKSSSGGSSSSSSNKSSSSSNSSNKSSSSSSSKKVNNSSKYDSALLQFVKSNFKSSANYNTLVARYKSAGSKYSSIKLKNELKNITNTSRKYLKEGKDVYTVSTSVYFLIDNYT